MAKTKKQTDQDIIAEQIVQLNKNLRETNKSFRIRDTIFHALLNGVFTGLGATIGLTLVVVVLAQILRGISVVPLIQDILKQTQLDKIIDYQLSSINKPNNEPTPTVTPTPTQNL